MAIDYTARMLTYLRDNLTDPASRTLGSGYNWIYKTPPDSDIISTIRYPFVITNIPSISSVDRGIISQRYKVLYSINAYSTNPAHLDSIVSELNSMFVVRKINGLNSPSVLVSSVTPINIDNYRMWELTYQISFISKVVDNV